MKNEKQTKCYYIINNIELESLNMGLILSFAYILSASEQEINQPVPF